MYTHARTHTHVHTHTRARTHTRTRTRTHKPLSSAITYACTHTCARTHAHIHTHIHIHTIYIHMIINCHLCMSLSEITCTTHLSILKYQQNRNVSKKMFFSFFFPLTRIGISCYVANEWMSHVSGMNGWSVSQVGQVSRMNTFISGSGVIYEYIHTSRVWYEVWVKWDKCHVWMHECLVWMYSYVIPGMNC